MKTPKLEPKDWLIILFGTLATIFISNIGIIFQSILNFSVSLSIVFSNFYYKEIAINDTGSIFYSLGLMSTIIFLMITSIYVNIVKISINLKFSNSDDINNNNGEIEENKDILAQNLTKEEKVKLIALSEKRIDDLKKKIEDRKQLISKNEKRKNEIVTKINKTSFMIVILISFLVLYILIRISFNSNIYYKNMTFRNQTRIIAPYIENKKLLELDSQWSSMKSKSDFTNINNEIKDIYKLNKLEY